ncbi:MAG TPA: hypothetical protein VIY48_20335 [Candidatus Paceibacterota bacterium]
MFDGGIISDLAIASTSISALGLTVLAVLSYREQLVWLVSMLVRPIYLYKLHRVGDDDIPRHSLAYVWAIQHRTDDRDRLSPQMNAWIDAAIPELNKLYDHLLGQ